MYEALCAEDGVGVRSFLAIGAQSKTFKYVINNKLSSLHQFFIDVRLWPTNDRLRAKTRKKNQSQSKKKKWIAKND